MRILIASDHAGYGLKENVKKELTDMEVVDLGTMNSGSTDYPDYAINLGERVVAENVFGVLICGTGIGMSIAANKVKGVRCAKVSSKEEVILSREHNNANVISLANNISIDEATEWIKTFVNEPFSNEERHIRRLNKIMEYEEK